MYASSEALCLLGAAVKAGQADDIRHQPGLFDQSAEERALAGHIERFLGSRPAQVQTERIESISI
jgi:hypothetical protein